MQIGVHRDEGESQPRIFLHRNDSCRADNGFALDLTPSEAAELIRELQMALAVVDRKDRVDR
ncbi:hypothetical protein [Amycolatopsis eburnea]|uniref:Uncharacterized protein n=1 Tax=Amycolatopsis eburnea TaxID=2267691 RepID=A0A3R9EW51_9PSEU|nr:hypothetical protein [Amycolatopsis eburnea]RSD23945.1 hypothetical protein EIY87_06130 [Amycolatopsis eburnea]